MSLLLPEARRVEKEKLIVVGRIVKPHGIRGELCVESYAASPELFAAGAAVTLRSPAGQQRVITVAASRPHQGRVLVFAEGIADRNAAETLRGMEVLVPSSALPDPGQDEVYLHEIEGFAVVLEDGSRVGVLESFLDMPGQDMWLIRSDQGKEILLPATPETVPEIDMDARRIVIAPAPGLLELF